jgi:hypothetical protein
MIPIPFKDQTIELQPNPNQLEIGGQSVGTLPIFTDGEQCISCWQLSFIERLKALWFGKIWLGIHAGRTQPPVWLSADNEVFKDK